MRWDNIGPPSDLAFAGAALLLPLNGHLAPATAPRPARPGPVLSHPEKAGKHTAKARKQVLTPRTPAPLDTSPTWSSYTPKAKAELQRAIAEAFANTAKLPVPGTDEEL